MFIFKVISRTSLEDTELEPHCTIHDSHLAMYSILFYAVKTNFHIMILIITTSAILNDNFTEFVCSCYIYMYKICCA